MPAIRQCVGVGRKLQNYSMGFYQRHFFRISFVIAVVLNINLFIASCDGRSANPTTTVDSSKNLNDHTPFEDTLQIAQGKSLFTTNCGACHAVFKTDNYLQGIVQRLGVNYLKIYVTKQDSLIQAKDAYALKVKRAFGNLANSHNFQFSDAQLNAIIAFLNKYSS